MVCEGFYRPRTWALFSVVAGELGACHVQAAGARESAPRWECILERLMAPRWERLCLAAWRLWLRVGWSHVRGGRGSVGGLLGALGRSCGIHVVGAA